MINRKQLRDNPQYWLKDLKPTQMYVKSLIFILAKEG